MGGVAFSTKLTKLGPLTPDLVSMVISSLPGRLQQELYTASASHREFVVRAVALHALHTPDHASEMASGILRRLCDAAPDSSRGLALEAPHTMYVHLVSVWNDTGAPAYLSSWEGAWRRPPIA